MICPDCGSKNQSNAKYCTQCGHRLEEADIKKCASCGHPNPVEYQFCVNCGSRLRKLPKEKNRSQAKKSKKKAKKAPKENDVSSSKKNEYILYSLLSIFILVLLFLAVMNKNSTENERTQKINIMELQDRDPLIEANFLEVADKFQCSCGACGETTLTTCECPTAEREKQFIREALKQGISVKETIALVQSKFGWIKPEYQGKMD